uniref:Uncharacterized protein n=1 Tax=Manihot esculenta TaxID=3983 RepID=A0A2C9VKG0_MANES
MCCPLGEDLVEDYSHVIQDWLRRIRRKMRKQIRPIIILVLFGNHQRIITQ